MNIPRLSVTSLLFTALVAGCGDDTSASGGAGGGAATGGGGGAAATCEAGKVCLSVAKEGEASGRLAVIWFRLEGTLAKDPTVGFETAFAGTESAVTIDLASVAQPPDLDLLCARGCADPATCPCTGDFQAGVAYVMVVVDADGSGALEAPEIADPANVVGLANTAVVYSAAAAASAPAPFDQTFPMGVKEGMAPYRINQDGAFEPGDAGAVYELKVGPGVL